MGLPRNIRLRKEYIYIKSLEGEERQLYDKMRKIREALQEGKPIPTELRNVEAKLRQEIDLEDQNTSAPRSQIDDEYAKATEKEPKILLTTSRDPSAPLSRFVKELNIVFPNATRVNRGSQVISEIIEAARSHDYSDVIFVTENRGKPDGLIVSHLPFGPTAYFELLNVVTRHEIGSKKAMGKVSEQYPHVIFDNFTGQMGKRVASMLKHMFPVPKLDARRIVTFHNKSDYISFRNHVYDKGEGGGLKSIELKEVGPRFELRLYQVKLGTMDQEEAEVEWALRPYMNSAKRRRFIGQ
ncbi:unnamed protein product [Eruca vesicaria subsp. sativa]|uniref:Brix domain-containing protein n=1 Tax=Eruca vesicaria subsp. sativa TaxID=29727 RepID=A0ABC8LB27_ERUVS|nr:unnamed protein product [Eruca vesicaria subsp. sativa]